MALPSLDSELVYLQNLHEILQKRLDLEREYTSSLAAWHTAAHKTGPQPTDALRVAFLSLVEAAEKDIQARQSMEATFRTQIDRVLAAMEELGAHLERITACSEKLEGFDELAREALKMRKLRHEKWETWKRKPVSSTGVWLWSMAMNEPVPSEGTMVPAYNLADRAVRKYVSKAEVARCSFKDKVMAQVDAISVAYEVVIDAITKCLRLFAEDQQECASHTSAGACRIVKVASDTFGFRLASAFQETLASEAQDISTDSIPYNDLLESDSRCPTQPIIFGFSLPPYYFSCTASTKFVVDVFCQVVSFVGDHQAWSGYLTKPYSTDYSLVPIFCQLERSWTKDENLNRDLLRSLGSSTCAKLVMALLVSFPEPLIDCSELPTEHLRLWNPDIVHRPDTTWTVPSDQDSGISPVPLVPRLYNRPQGEMLRALCVSLIPVFSGTSKDIQKRFCEIFSDVLTRKGKCIKHVIPNLVREFSTIITTINTRNALAFDSLRKAVFGLFGHVRGVTPHDPSTTSDIESRRDAIINTAKNKANAPHTILLVGGTGLGKSSLVEFIANTLPSRDGDYYGLASLDRTKTRGRFGSGTWTASPHLYEIASKLGGLIRILDTPGFTDTHSFKHDELLKESIVMSVEKHLDSITAVLIHADSTSNTMDYALSTLSTILPKTLANNIAFVFTNVSTPSLQGFSVPEVFKDAPTFVFDIPIAPERMYVSHGLKAHKRAGGRRFESAAEQSALEMLAKLFNWMGNLNLQPVTEITYLFEKYQNIKTRVNTLTQMDQATTKKAIFDELMTWLKENSIDMDSFSNFEKTVDMLVSKRQPMTTRTIDKGVLANQYMKMKWETAKEGKEKTAKPIAVIEMEQEQTAALIAVIEMVLHDLSQATSRPTNNLASLLEQYAYLSLTGSLSVQMESTVKFLEQKYIVMEGTGVGKNELEKVKERLDQMKWELELLDNTKEIG